jgi:hypothetical protein
VKLEASAVGITVTREIIIIIIIVCFRNISVDTLHKGDTEDNNIAS